ncbi:hypothetical protein VP01_12943g1, partial [Puccinia sorghi]
HFKTIQRLDGPAYKSNPQQGKPVYCHTLSILIKQSVEPNQKAMRLAELSSPIRNHPVTGGGMIM